jgi:MYXO-CTERM domain-containing protein
MNGVGVSAIQPIVLTFRGTEACVPLRLTAIAANPDMPVLVWVLGDTRVAPRGYYEIVIDDASIDWERNGTNYFGATGLVSRAANEAGGNAFVTEYAGPSDIARQSVYTNGQINLTTLGQAMIPPAYVQLLAQMGLANDPLILPLLGKYIPMPDAVKKMGVTDVQFYGNISVYWNQFAFPPYDLVGLTDAISMSIVTPRMNAQMMLDAHPMLTRLNTFISPEEMTDDPFFFETQSLPNLSSRHAATIRIMCGNRQFTACNAPRRLELSDGRFIWLNKGVAGTTCQYPVTDLSDLKTLPTLQVAFERELMGDGTRVIDNTTTIGKAIDAHNKAYATEMTMFPPPPMGGAGGGGLDAAGAPGTGGTGAGGAAGHAVNQVSNGGGGCGCGVADGDGGGLAFFAVAAALRLVLARRRRD